MGKKHVILLALVVLSLALGGCLNPFSQETKTTQVATSRAKPTKPSTEPTTATTQSEATESQSSQETTTQQTGQTTSQETSQHQEQVLAESTYADMLAYDPLTGLADFDCFNLLQGDEAVDWLIENEEYTQAQAQAEVDQFADSEFIEDRPGQQLLAVDLSQASLSLIYEPDGELLFQEVSYDFIAFNAFFENHPDAVLDSFFYRVMLEAGEVVAVEQVYWP